MNPTTAENPPNAALRPRRTTARGMGGVAALLVLLGGATIFLAVGGAPSAAATPATQRTLAPMAMTSAAAGPTGSWAWGAIANVSISAQFLGAYNASQALVGGNLTTNGAYLAVDESASLGYAVYAIVNLTSPNATARYVTVQAAELQVEKLNLVATGTFPVAGTYPAGAAIPLAPMNLSLAASIEVLSVYLAFVNYTAGPNGSLAVVNEHVAFARAVNISLAAVNYPNVTSTAPNTTTIRYDTGAISEQAFVGIDLRANFTPALPIIEGPLFVGKSWWANSTVAFRGAASYASLVTAKAGSGATYSASNSGAVAVNVTAPVRLHLAVTGTTTIVYPNGQNETDYVITVENGNGSNVLVANGLVVLPGQDPTHSAGVTNAVSERPAAAAATPATAAPTRAVYSPARHMVDSQQTTPSSGKSVTAVPMGVAQAKASMRSLGQPARPAPAGTGHGTVVLLLLLLVGGGAAVVLVRQSRRRPPRRGVRATSRAESASVVPPGARLG
ncbi:MAG: hypothetical protein L3K15_05175 [Thermoplasmata archaeon]|nr:hypothetical protein [Thermoplasmata archaeon]